MEKWLAILLNIYELVDSWAEEESEARGIKGQIACCKGCGHCCKVLTVPINPWEFRGLCWYVTEKLPKDKRRKLKDRLRNCDQDSECPFLMDDACLVYPVRPIACRQFFVLNIPCSESENPWLVRPGDIYCALNKQLSWLIAQKYLLLYGITDELEQRKAYNQGFLAEEDQPLPFYAWRALSDRIS